MREFVGTETTTNGYWRFNTPYGYQLGAVTKVTSQTISNLCSAVPFTGCLIQTSATMAPMAHSGPCYQILTWTEGESCPRSRGLQEALPVGRSLN